MGQNVRQPAEPKKKTPLEIPQRIAWERTAFSRSGFMEEPLWMTSN
jgi:hypothetical protein